MAKEFKPWPYQEYCIEQLMEKPNVALWLDMGLGKTVITLTAIFRLKYECWGCGKALVIAPLKVAEAVWETEAGAWQHLNKLRVVPVLGSEAQRLAALERAADVYVINRENVAWLVNHYQNRWPFDTVVIDEASSFKNPQAKRFKALRAVRPHIHRMIELTGTPRPRSLEDLWAQVYLLDSGKRLGRTITAYRQAFFTPGRRNRTTIFDYQPVPGAEAEIFGRLSDICISMKSDDYLQLPELVYQDIPVKLDDEARRRYDRLERDALLQVDPESVITASTAAALDNKLLQLCNGAVYDEDGKVIPVHDCKLDALMETVEALDGEHAIICYNYRHDAERILRAFSGGSVAGVSTYTGEASEIAWNAGKVRFLLIQPASAGYGLNLQLGGHHIIWFGLTWNLEYYAQTNKRLHRQGQKYPVFVHNLVVQGSRDEDVIASLRDKDAGQERLLQALKARVKRVHEEAL